MDSFLNERKTDGGKKIGFGIRVIRLISIVSLIAACLLRPLDVASQSPIPADRDSVYRQLLDFGKLVRDASLEPHWMADKRSFWYVEGAPANTVVLKIDPAANTIEPLFDTARLRSALEPVLEHKPPYEGLPFETFQFVDDEQAIRFEVEKRAFRLDLDTYRVSAAVTDPKDETPNSQEPTGEIEELPAPRGRWTAVAKDHNLWLRSSDDGVYGRAYFCFQRTD